MPRAGLEIGEEVGAKRAFVWAVDWPGWCRAGKDAGLAREALVAYAPRYDVVVQDRGPGHAGRRRRCARHRRRRPMAAVAPISASRRRSPTPIADGSPGAEAARLGDLVEAAWTVFEQVAAGAPPTLRKGPRGGGRDRDKMIDHVIERGSRLRAGDRDQAARSPHRGDRAAVDAERAAVLDVLRTPSDGGPLADRKWTQRYAARRIAWHALDHAWEMEDRAEPA